MSSTTIVSVFLPQFTPMGILRFQINQLTEQEKASVLFISSSASYMDEYQKLLTALLKPQIGITDKER